MPTSLTIYWNFIKEVLPILSEIIGIIFMYIEIKFPQTKSDLDRKVQGSFEFYLYSSNIEWGERMKYYWSIKNFKNATGIYEKASFIFIFLLTWVFPIALIALYFLRVHKHLFPHIMPKVWLTVLCIFLVNLIWFIYALLFVGPIRFVISKIDKFFNGNVLGGLGFIFALLGILAQFFSFLLK